MMQTPECVRSAVAVLRRAAGRRPGAGLALSTATPSAPTPAEIDAAIAVLARARKVEVQWRGYDFQSAGYYSPVNDLDFLWNNRDLWHDRGTPREISWDLDAQLEVVATLSPWVAELRDVPGDAPAGPPVYHWNNDFWTGVDAIAHYGLLRQRRPRRVVEVGSGWSSLLMAQALRRNESEGTEPASVEQIEPYPREALLSELPDSWKLQTSSLQRADLGVFERLEAGDVCFYDGSHVSRTASDVNWFVFEVLPRLKPGVLIHVHDIFWPDDYPDPWIVDQGQTWNEQYVLQAFLMFNDRFRILFGNSALLRYRQPELSRLFGDAGPLAGGASVWLERVS